MAGNKKRLKNQRINLTVVFPDLGLLEHDLGYPDGKGIIGFPPGDSFNGWGPLIGVFWVAEQVLG
jgi:hypothetical protein